MRISDWSSDVCSSDLILPFWCSSSRLTQRIMVDLPEPDGPQMTMRSPRLTVRLMAFRTWNSPYHLCMPTIWIATSSEMRICAAASDIPVSLLVRPRAPTCCGLALVAGVQPLLQIDRIARHAEAADEEEQRDEDVNLPRQPLPTRVRQRCAADSQQDRKSTRL